jgi:NAD(P)H-hydrate repair Nnr-like enzyme with NAD(P)H-hydrate dehydratase domain
MDQDARVELASTAISEWLPRLHTLVVGPGLGRDPTTLACVGRVITAARAIGLPLVVDADGLFLITTSPTLIKDYPAHVILTPNAVEVGWVDLLSVALTVFLVMSGLLLLTLVVRML